MDHYLQQAPLQGRAGASISTSGDAPRGGRRESILSVLGRALRFRPGLSADLGRCGEILRRSAAQCGAIRVSDPSTDGWPALLASPSAHFLVFEDLRDTAAERVCGFAFSVLVTDDFVQELADAGAGDAGVAFYRRWGSRRSALMTERDAASANATRGVNVLVLHCPLPDGWASAGALMQAPMAISAFHWAHAGYLCRSVLWNACDAALVRVLGSVGFRPLGRDRGGVDHTGAAPVVPMVMGIFRDEIAEPALHLHAAMYFSRTMPLMRLTGAQRRLLRLAMFGMNDREIAAALTVSGNRPVSPILS